MTQKTSEWVSHSLLREENSGEYHYQLNENDFLCVSKNARFVWLLYCQQHKREIAKEEGIRYDCKTGTAEKFKRSWDATRSICLEHEDTFIQGKGLPKDLQDITKTAFETYKQTH